MLSKKEKNTVFVCYAFSRDNEFIFSLLDNDLKDKLFQSHINKQQTDALEVEQERLDEILFGNNKDTQDYQLADFEKYVNHLSLLELQTVFYNDYKLALANGKKLTITKNKRSITVYDLFSFFRKSLFDAVQVWLKQEVEALKRETLILPEVSEIEQLKILANIETKYIVKIADKLEAELNAIDIKLSRYHGAGGNL